MGRFGGEPLVRTLTTTSRPILMREGVLVDVAPRGPAGPFGYICPLDP
jgi:hypothetical protein